MKVNGVEYRVWTSMKGYGMRATCRSHLVPMVGDRTLCGLEKGRMTTRYTTFDSKNDCSRCAKKAQTAPGIGLARAFDIALSRDPFEMLARDSRDLEKGREKKGRTLGLTKHEATVDSQGRTVLRLTAREWKRLEKFVADAKTVADLREKYDQLALHHNRHCTCNDIY